MKTLAIILIGAYLAHAGVGALMESKTAKNLKNHNAQIELAVKGM